MLQNTEMERRRHPRFIIDLPVRYHKLEESDYRYGRAMNLSEGGLLIYSSEKINIEQQLKSKIFFLSGSELNNIEIKAQVIWTDIDLNKAWGDFRSGLKVVDISTADLSKLRTLLETLPQ